MHHATARPIYLYNVEKSPTTVKWCVEILTRVNAKVRGVHTTGTYEPKTRCSLSVNHSRGHICTTKLKPIWLRHKQPLRPLRPLTKKHILLPIVLPPTNITNILRPPLKYKRTHWPIKTSDSMVILPAISRTCFAAKALTTAPLQRNTPQESSELISH